ncbi:helix-turn-helix domain-containing protein [Thalassobacillus hwangdonensis]|uniref:Helix-turn-helix domain-containing protein n=1 Tax=Thalassobacillus hwangdonensis TaxID=546108 RepID=A0ABW3L5A1_9BACI
MREWLIELRKEKAYTQQKVAECANIDRAYYAQIENGTRNPSVTVAKKIAGFLKVNPSTFFVEGLSDPFELALTNSPILITHCDLHLRITWLFNPHPDFDVSTIIGKRIDEVITGEGAEKAIEVKRQVIQEACPIRKEIQYSLSEGLLTYDMFAQPIRNDHGEVVGVATVSVRMA